MRNAFSLVVTLVVTMVLATVAPAQSENSAAFAILIDNSASLRTQSDKIRRISKGIVERTHKRGPISLFSFEAERKKRGASTAITSGVEWSRDKQLLESRLDDIATVSGQTALFDAIHSVAERFSATAGDKNAFSEKIIFLVTDGEDRSSKVKEAQLIKFPKENSIKIYAVGLIGEEDERAGLMVKFAKERSVRFLEKITKETGGRVVFARHGSVDVRSLLDALFAKEISLRRCAPAVSEELIGDACGPVRRARIKVCV